MNSFKLVAICRLLWMQFHSTSTHSQGMRCRNGKMLDSGVGRGSKSRLPPSPVLLHNTLDSGGFRGGSGGLLEPPSGTKLFQFHLGNL